MQTSKSKKLVLTSAVKQEIVQLIDTRIREAHVTREDFSELKEIVRDLAAAQKRTEERLEQLTEAQRNTDRRVEQLAEAQQRTERRLEQLAEAQRQTEIEVRKLAVGLNETRNELGGLARSFGYAFENEAFRMLPSVLLRDHGITVKDKIIRAEVGGKEINLLSRGEKEGREVLLVGEAKVRLDERREGRKPDVFDELDEKVQAVLAEYGPCEVVKVLVTHYATGKFLELAREKGVIVVQSFEW
ncbi:MAG: hypothetical protein ONB48_17095 [candidate division KSB1 bacterium]|nr:hypothetical protein [candidate division KSB1 bacterium]MDZ7275195.1 hypothetical protein [candidate division KSB1 bacterium]MDZ7287364.1 hypothetical protein [candidate division KSB1 bacterium]MDZ7299478.1 hypothetical protein [candidate division KSB1 bacterium]MDZ7305476.1 hypothetical protein [candidate division KSB1 bacterium]